MYDNEDGVRAGGIGGVDERVPTVTKGEVVAVQSPMLPSIVMYTTDDLGLILRQPCSQ